MTDEQQVFVATCAQVLPTLLIALGVFHWRGAEAPKARRHPKEGWAWLLYFVLPLLAEGGLLSALLLTTYGVNVSGFLAYFAMPVTAVSGGVILLALLGFIAAALGEEPPEAT